MTIYSWNINGIRSVWQKGLWDWFNKVDPDILCLQEIKAQPEEFPNSLFENTNHYLYINPAVRRGYAGVAIYTKEKGLKINRTFGDKNFDQEGRFLELEFPNFSLVNLYMPHGNRDKNKLGYKLDIYKRLQDRLSEHRHKNLILVGDFNIAHQEIDLGRPKQNLNNIMFTPEERQQIDKLLNLGFIDSFRHLHKEGGHYSWLSYLKNARERGLGWRIDYIFIPRSLENRLKEATIFPEVSGSDHCPIMAEITFPS